MGNTPADVIDATAKGMALWKKQIEARVAALERAAGVHRPSSKAK